MKKKNTVIAAMRRSGLTLLLLLAALLFPLNANAADAKTPNYCNTVVMVRFAGDAADSFHLEFDAYGRHYSNWDMLQQMYSTGGTDYDYSSKAFLYAVSEGQVRVDNYFPQGTAQPYTLLKAQSGYASSDELVTEVIAAINGGQIVLDPAGHPLDRRTSGQLDNLTILVQGDAGDDRSGIYYPHKADYYGNPIHVGGKDYQVTNYNVIDSASLLSADGTSVYSGERQGVISHELLHTLGFADLYRYAGGGDPVGYWDIMAAASPYQQYPLAYTRMQAGYLTLPQTLQPGTYSLDAVGTKGGTCGLIIRSPLSDSEFFVVEYRSPGNIQKYEFDSGLHLEGKGLLIYRVDTAYNTNAQGDDYLYVFRPDTQSVHGAEESVLGASVVPDQGETAYGSTDLKAAYTQDTLFFSNGQNSGIQLENIHLDGEKMAFDVRMADYAQADIWTSLNAQPTEEASGNIATASDGSSIYLACATMKTDVSSTHVLHHTDAGWKPVGDTLTGYSEPRIAWDGSALILSAISAQGKLCYFQYDGIQWKLLWTETATDFYGMGFFSDTDGWKAYSVSGGQLKICDAYTGVQTVQGLRMQLMANPAVCRYQGGLYALTSDVGAAGEEANAAVFRYSADGTWERQQSLPVSKAGMNTLYSDGKNLYALAGNASTSILATFDGSSWTTEKLPVQDLGYAALYSGSSGLVLVYLENSGQSAAALQRVGGKWQALGSEIATSCGYLSSAFSGNSVYTAAVLNGTGKIAVRSRVITSEAEGLFTGVREDAKTGQWLYYEKGVRRTDFTGMAADAAGNFYYVSGGKVQTNYIGMVGDSALGWCYVTNGKLDTSYTGMAANAAGWWYMTAGRLDWKYTGIATNTAGTWYMKNGKLDWSASGLLPSGSDYYEVSGGKVQTDHTGMAVDSTLGWCYVTNGKLDTSYTGMAANGAGWWYMTAGRLNWKYTGIAVNGAGTWYMKNGALSWSANGLLPSGSDYYEVSGGKVQTNYTGMVGDSALGWCYVTNGKLDTSYTGMAENAAGWWYMTAGRLDWKYTGIASNKTGTWYIKNGKLDLSANGLLPSGSDYYDVSGGKVQTNYTGMVGDSTLGWCYVTNGRLDTGYTGMAANAAGWWYIRSGRLDWNYTGIADNGAGTWYMKNGALDWSANGILPSAADYYYVINGQVQTSFSGTIADNGAEKTVLAGKVVA